MAHATRRGVLWCGGGGSVLPRGGGSDRSDSAVHCAVCCDGCCQLRGAPGGGTPGSGTGMVVGGAPGKAGAAAGMAGYALGVAPPVAAA